MATTLLDPTGELQTTQRPLNQRLAGLQGVTIGLLDISKPRGKEFLDEVQRQLEALGASVQRYMKPTFTRVAPIALSQQIAQECDAVIEGLAD
ncbi:MAG: hypothetical protein RLZZ385_519 [Pseudomonadota bacterium]|jgi:hypothetical protein